jgi:pimeloyl-ACP methyl ester carboxylesterase
MKVRGNLSLPERWHAQYVSEPVFGSRMYIVEAGRPNAPVVLLVHGLGESGYQDWWETIHGIEARYRVITMDLPGFGRSTVPHGELSPPRYARLLHWLTEQLGLDEFHVVGHSMGAAVALYYAGEYPERVANVVLVDAAGCSSNVRTSPRPTSTSSANLQFASMVPDSILLVASSYLLALR